MDKKGVHYFSLIDLYHLPRLCLSRILMNVL